MNLKSLVLASALALPSIALAQTGWSITGGLSNFDCHNECDDPCDEFEIEIEDIRPEDVVHTYRNGNYGSPTVTPSARGTIIDYRHPQHLTAVGSIEHFGVSLRALGPTNAIHVRWMRNGQPATVNGQIPNPNGNPTPATQPIMPTITSDTTFTGTGDGVVVTVVNNDPNQAIWIQRSGRLYQGLVTLEALMRDNPVVTESAQFDTTPVFLPAGSSTSITTDLLEIEEQQTVVFSVAYRQSIFVGGPFGGHWSAGPELGNVMTASTASAGGTCDFYAPVILVQPQNVTADEGRSVDVRVDADGNDMPLTYQWMKEGFPLVNGGLYSGVTSDGLSIDELTSATEGFYSCLVSNACGSVITQSALVFITGHNVPPPRPTCIADVDDGSFTGTTDGGVTIDDLLYYLFIFEAGDVAADVDDGTSTGTPDGGVTIDDLLYYLIRFEAGC